MRLIILRKKWLVALLMLAVSLTTFTVLNIDNDEQALSGSSFRFVVMGDSQGDAYDDQINEHRFRQLLADVTETPAKPSFILFAGDMVWGEENIKRDLAHWKDIVDDYYPLKQVYPALGNHEHDEDAFSAAFNHLPKNQLLGYQRTVYYFDYGNSRFIVLNSDRTNNHGYILEDEQLAWLEKVLKSSKMTHNFVMMHVPAYPVGSHYHDSLDDNPEQRDALWQLVDKYNVTAVFNGHEHNYNRRVVDDTFGNYKNKTLQLTLGGAGGELSDYVRDDKNVVVGPEAIHHYLSVEVKGDTAYFKVYDAHNKEIDAFTVTK